MRVGVYDTPCSNFGMLHCPSTFIPKATAHPSLRRSTVCEPPADTMGNDFFAQKRPRRSVALLCLAVQCSVKELRPLMCVGRLVSLAGRFRLLEFQIRSACRVEPRKGTDHGMQWQCISAKHLDLP